jgi:UDP-N-acetylmuramyl tripeptide synthase
MTSGLKRTINYVVVGKTGQNEATIMASIASELSDKVVLTSDNQEMRTLI